MNDLLTDQTFCLVSLSPRYGWDIKQTNLSFSSHLKVWRLRRISYQAAYLMQMFMIERAVIYWPDLAAEQSKLIFVMLISF